MNGRSWAAQGDGFELIRLVQTPNIPKSLKTAQSSQPESQFSESGEVVRGISDVVKIIENPELAWDSLTHEWPFAHSAEVPLEKLRRGEVEEVIGAAPSYGFAFT